MKSLGLLVVAFLLTPGSGQLRWDGLPLSTPLEFASLVVLLLLIFNPIARAVVRRAVEGKTWSGLLRPLACGLIFLKFLTFAWSPFSDGFEACYRSIYYPLSNPSACERSYEAPFLTRSDQGLSNTTRIEKSLDFDSHPEDWNLPFINEFPRFNTPWIYRFPFTAQFAATLRSNSASPMYLPVVSNGRVSAAIGGVSVETENYEFEQLTVVPIPDGQHRLTIRYEYRDDSDVVPPETAPVPRGAYATLKVGAPIGQDDVLSSASVRIRGWVFDKNRMLTPRRVRFVPVDGTEVTEYRTIARPDVATHFDESSLLNSGFDFSVPLRSLLNAGARVLAVFDDREVTLGKISIIETDFSRQPSSVIMTDPSVLTQFSGILTMERDDIQPLTPRASDDLGLRFQFLIYLLDAIGLIVALGSAFGVVWLIRKSLTPMIGLVLGAVAAVTTARAVLPSVLGQDLLLPLTLLAICVVAVANRTKIASALVYLPTAAVLGYWLVFEKLRAWTQQFQDNWWGRLYFYPRDSDWYTIQGNARELFLTGSLQAGEAVFWFNVGPRYLAYAIRSLLGENDLLIAVLMLTIGIWSLLVFIGGFVCQHRDVFATCASVAVMSIMLLLLSDETIAAFGFVGSSEYPTWIALLIVSRYILMNKTDVRAWPMILMTILLVYCIQARHNQAFALAFLLIMLLLRVDRRNPARAISTTSIMIVVFGAGSLLSLLHNLYYGESFVIFSANAAINEAFSWLDVLGLSTGPASLSDVLSQMRVMLYWGVPSNWAYALAFWGAQILWMGVICFRLKRGILIHARSLLLLLPIFYAIPMLKYQMFSYYPRHLVAINLSFMCAAVLAWGRDDSQPNTSRDLGQRSLEEIPISEVSPA